MPTTSAPVPSTRPKDNRRHHKVPVALLGRFTDDGTDDGLLYVGDPLKKEWRPSTPRAECAERGYYAVDADGWGPGDVEDMLAEEIDGPAGAILKSIAATQREPSKPETGVLVQFLGMQALRVDQFRKALFAHDKAIADRVIAESSTDVAFDEYERAHGVKFPPEKRAKMREINFEYVGNTRPVDQMLRTFGNLLNDLRRLRWRVVTLPMGSPNLVCSDHPASYVRVREDGRLQTIMGGWARPDVAALMPLSTRQLLIGSTEALVPLLDDRIDRCAVSEFNHVTVMAARWIYASEPKGAGLRPLPLRTPKASVT